MCVKLFVYLFYFFYNLQFCCGRNALLYVLHVFALCSEFIKKYYSILSSENNVFSIYQFNNIIIVIFFLLVWLLNFYCCVRISSIKIIKIITTPTMTTSNTTSSIIIFLIEILHKSYL